MSPQSSPVFQIKFCQRLSDKHGEAPIKTLPKDCWRYAAKGYPCSCGTITYVGCTPAPAPGVGARGDTDPLAATPHVVVVAAAAAEAAQRGRGKGKGGGKLGGAAWHKEELGRLEQLQECGSS